MFRENGFRLSVFSHDQVKSKPSVSAAGPPRVIRSSTVSLLVLKPPPASQLFLNVTFVLMLPPFTRRSPSLFQDEQWLKFRFRLRKKRFGTSLRIWNQP